MKKNLSFLITVIFIFNIFSIENIFAEKNNYLLINKNYYEEKDIDKGFLDEVISEENVNSNEDGGNTRWQKFQNAVAKNLVNYTPGMTYNEYFLANNISPEDAFKLYIRKGNPGDQEVLLPSGGLLTSEHKTEGRSHNGEIVDYITYVGPYKDRSAHWNDKELETPIVFSRLTAGKKLIENPRNNLFPNQIGYNKDSTINDYMMTDKNNIIIPVRYNEKRDDIFLTMRSAGFFGNSMKDARAFLSAESDGKKVLGDFIELYGGNPRFNLMTNTEILLTPFAYDQLGTLSKFMFGFAMDGAKENLKNIPVNKFADEINAGLGQIQNFSSVNDIKGGNGGQIQIIGFYREGIEYEQKNCSGITNLNDRRNCLNDYLNNYKIFSSLESERKIDSEKIVNVKYYMYTNSTPAGSTISTPLASNGKHLYSPNESTFKIEITRPFFKGFGNFNNEILFNEESFDEKIGEKSFEIEDNGVFKKVLSDNIIEKREISKIPVDKNRVRVRISEDNGENYFPEKYTIDELKQKLKEISQDENNIGKKITIAYTYIPIDVIEEIKERIAGKLPSEIKNISSDLINFFKEKGIGRFPKEISNISPDIIKEIDNKILGNLPKEIENNTGTYAIPFIRNIYIPAKIIVKHIDEAGNEIESETKEGEIGKEYEFSEKTFPDYEFVKIKEGDSKTGNFEKTEKIITFIYKKLEKQTEGKIFIKFLDENNNEIFPAKTEIGKIGEDFNFSSENISDYEFVKIFDGDLAIGKFTEKDQTIRFIYKKKESSPTNPTPTIPEIGKIIIKYFDEVGNEIKTEIKEGKIGENYEISEKKISGYEFVKILDGDSKTGNFEEKEKIITFIYKKIENKIENSGSSPVVPVIQKDPRVTYINENIPKIEEPKIDEKIIETPKVEEPKIEVKDTLPKDFEAVSPMGDEEDVEVEKVIKKIEKTTKKLPTTGPITQEEIYKKGGKKKENSKVETKLPDARTFDLAQSGEKNLNIWLDKLPPKDRNKDKYVVLPEQGLILPINTVSRDSKEYKRFTSGKEENFEAYLNKGTVELPITRRGYGEIGNKIIAGHSSYWKKSKATYKTHFQKIIGLEKEEEVWIFEKNSKTKKFEKYIYKVTASYNTDDEDISILKQGKISELTLFTCTPIGGFDGRWVVKAKFLKKE